MRRIFMSLVLLATMAWTSAATAQSAPAGSDETASDTGRLRVEGFHYRPARWNAEQVTEYENEHPNLGGLLYFYLTNEGEEPVDLRFWRYNNRDESYWLLNHLIAWHRLYQRRIGPGETTVLEINATARDFGPGVPFVFQLVDDTWQPCLEYRGNLEEAPATLSYIRVLPDLRSLEVHLRGAPEAAAEVTGLEVVGLPEAEVEWRGRDLAKGGSAIARVRLAEPLATGTLLVVRAKLKTGEGERWIHAHRRVFPDFFPIGTWGMDPDLREYLAGDHVDTGVVGGKRDDAFFGDAAGRLGLNAMVHTGEPVNVDMVRDLSGHPAVACWMLRDEPDWSMDPQIVLFCDETVRALDRTKPTFVNLCRNTKFFEYAPIGDIPGHDHYCVSAPSSSRWPHPYGTRLEETAWYTEDLKYASEPKPIWVWSQGNHDGWSERPLRPLPTPEELSAQLVLNLGRGAKGILWFTYNRRMGEAYPETRDAMRGWNRVMAVLREDLQSSEPVKLKAEGPERVDVASLASWDKLILCLTNLDYRIHPEAYPFQPRQDVAVSVALPEWVRPVAAVRVSGAGVSEVPLRSDGGQAHITLESLTDGAVVVLLNEESARQAYADAYAALLAKEGSERTP